MDIKYVFFSSRYNLINIGPAWQLKVPQWYLIIIIIMVKVAAQAKKFMIALFHILFGEYDRFK